MKQSKLALTAVMVVAIGLTGANLVGDSLKSTEDISTAEFGTSLPFYGHLTAIHYDPEGNILSYMQTDNIVTHEGKDCAIERLFSGPGVQGCPGTVTDFFDRIGLTDGQTFKVTANATALNAEDNIGNGLDPQDATTVTSDTNATGTAGSIIDIVTTFTSTLNGKTVDGAILYNTAETVAFAAKEFTGGTVTLNDQDTLEVTWTITLGGA